MAKSKKYKAEKQQHQANICATDCSSVASHNIAERADNCCMLHAKRTWVALCYRQYRDMRISQALHTVITCCWHMYGALCNITTQVRKPLNQVLQKRMCLQAITDALRGPRAG